VQAKTMTYFYSYEVPKYKLFPLIGEEVKKGIVGSTAYFMKSFDSTEAIDLMENSKGIFQVFTKGLLLRVCKNNNSISLPIPFKEITKLELNKGDENVEPFLLSPMWILLKFGIKIEIARYFRIRLGEYSIGQTTLKIETLSFKLELQTNGYTFNSQDNFFSKLTEIENLNITKKPALNNVHA
jgi:hypothetical protein